MAAPLEAVVSRLEAVASRLERLEVSALSSGGGGGGGGAAAPAASSSAGGAPPRAGGGGDGAGADPLSAYNALASGPLAAAVAAAAAAGGDVQKATARVAAAFEKQRAVIATSLHAKQPGMADLQALLKPVADEMVAAGQLADDRRSAAFQQLKVVAESINGLSWLAYTGPSCGMPLPAQHVADSWNAAEFYANKLMMALKGKDETQIAWLKALKELNVGLQQYLRQHFPQGLKWNPAGGSIADAQRAAAAGGSGAPAAAPAPAPAPAAKGPPPPPPPPSMDVLLKERPGGGGSEGGGGGGSGGGGLKDVFKQLAQGGGVTAGLRKVTDDMKAKNRTDKTGTVPASAAAAPAAPAAAAGRSGPPMGTPKLELQGDRKWVVEHHSGNREIMIDRTDPKHTVYIYNCHNCVVQVRGKVNAVSIDGCKRTGVVFEQVIATCELVNCGAMQVQCLGAVPTVSIDKCDGCQVFINQDVAAGDFQLVTAKSSEVNLTVVPADQNLDAVEHPVPEQFISSFQNGRLVTVAASHSGG